MERSLRDGLATASLQNECAASGPARTASARSSCTEQNVCSGVGLTHSARPGAMTAICALLPFRSDAKRQQFAGRDLFTELTCNISPGAGSPSSFKAFGRRLWRRAS